MLNPDSFLPNIVEAIIGLQNTRTGIQQLRMVRRHRWDLETYTGVVGVGLEVGKCICTSMVTHS